ncbi:MAG: transcription termination factor Rho [Lachnospiraceae bacterium]|nr:transcription termination factor Rho [Lachnospiraceae bacterium]
MSIDLEKESLVTLKEWAHLLGIRSISNARKPELVDLLTRVGDKRVEYAKNLAEQTRIANGEPPREKKKPGRKSKKQLEEEAAARAAASQEKAAEQAESKTAADDTKAEPSPTPRYFRYANASEEKKTDGSPERADKPERRTVRSVYDPSPIRNPGRGGFGSYAPSYRAQLEAADNQERQPRARFEMPAPERRSPAEETRPSYRAADEEKSLYRSTAEEERLIQKAGEDKQAAYPDNLAGPLGEGILEVMPEGFGFIRCENYMPGDNDIYVSPAQIHRFGLKTGDILAGVTKIKTSTEKFPALLYINTVNGESPDTVRSRTPFEDLTPEFPHERIHLETDPEARAMRIVDLMAPIGKGQRGMIVSPPKAGKTTLIKDVAKAVTRNHPDMQLIILLIDERPEEVTDIKEEVEGPNVEVIYSTFDETPEHHKRVTEMVLGRAQRLVEHGRDVIILLDSITRLSRAYNLTVAPSGRTLSGGLDPAALHMPKKFFGAARCMREGGSLTVLATALVETGSRMDDVIFEEFKGTGNMELVLDRKLSERRIFPAIDILKSGTRREDKLLTPEELETVTYIRQAISNPVKGEEALETILDLMKHTRTNQQFCALVRKMRF